MRSEFPVLKVEGSKSQEEIITQKLQIMCAESALKNQVPVIWQEGITNCSTNFIPYLSYTNLELDKTNFQRYSISKENN